jgi:hypothetical protein
MNNVAKKPDIEIRRKFKNGMFRTYVVIYWKPFSLWAFGKKLK